MSTKPPHLFLIDGSGYIFRAFFGLPSMHRADGTPVNAVFGFCTMLMGLLEGNEADYLGVIFDTSRQSFRNEIYPEYKAHRDEPPPDLRPQFALIREAVQAFTLPSLEMQGYEADDLIATYCRLGVEAKMDVTIVTSDKDMMQLVRPGVSLWDPVRNRKIGPDEVKEKFGVTPDKVIDVQALAGDSADNVPGVPGIGPKTAAELINLYGDLDELLARASEIRQPKRRESLIEFADQARLSRQLVTLEDKAPLPSPLEDLRRQALDRQRLYDFFVKMEFRRLLPKLAPHQESGQGRDPRMQAVNSSQDSTTAPQANLPAEQGAATPLSSHDENLLAAPYGPYEMIVTEERLIHWIEKAFAQGFVAFDCETSGLDIKLDNLVGFSLALAPAEAAYVPLAHGVRDQSLPQSLLPQSQPSSLQPVQSHDISQGDLFADMAKDRKPSFTLHPEQLSKQRALELIRPLLESPAVLKIGQNIKFDLNFFAAEGIAIAPIDDTMLISFAIEAGLSGHGMDELSSRHLHHQPIEFDSLTGKGAKRISFAEVEMKLATEYAAEDADVTLRLWLKLKPKMRQMGKVFFYESIERPLVPVLAAMEREGILIDRPFLTDLESRFRRRLNQLEGEVHELAGERFNLASPSQLAVILFDKMGVPAGDKTSGGARSTAHNVLEPLAENYPIIARLLDWRQMAKLISTYCEALAKAANRPSGRVHTSFSMTGAQTGRLSSVDPNLQNIPIRTEEGKEIRRAFIAPPGFRLVSLDYSQIELRLLAEMADIESLRQAFIDGQDIHAATAAEVFGLPLADVTPDLRRKSKAINFGIVYGISAFGLSRQIQSSPGEAKEFINRYFAKFPGIESFMKETKRFCRLNGYVETLFGRRIHISGINDVNKMRAAGAERQAINAPIQGSAADVIKRAMVRLPKALEEAGLSRSRLLLQVHDELVFEVPEADCQELIALASRIMENAAAPAKPMKTPLKVEAGIGLNWAAAH